MDFEKQYDIVVVGLGTAGAISLITAAKNGARTLGIEKLSAMGGTGTLGGISHYYYGAEGGIYEEFDREIDALRDKICRNCQAKRTDVRSYVYEREAFKYGAEIMYNSVVTGVYKEGEKVCGLCCFDGEREIKIATKMVIDATGEAQICRMAGCKMQGGRASDAQVQTFANVAMVRNDNNVYGMNKDAGYVRQSDCRDLSQKIIESTALSLKMTEVLRDKTTFVANTALLGCREGSRIVGEESISLQAAAMGKEEQRPVFYAFSNIDNHSKDTAFEDTAMKDWYIAAGLWGVAIRVGVPMGALIPKGIDGIIAAGRCISTEHNTAALVRMMRDMKRCGEAAAEMAVMAVHDKVDVRDIDYNKLSNKLKKSGCLSKNSPRFAARTKEVNGSREFEWLTDTDEIINALASDSPGTAIWSARIMGDAVAEKLIPCLESENENLRKHAAIALGLLDNKKALPLLRQMAAERDIFIPKSSVKFTYARGVSAVYLLGRMGDSDSAELLLDIVRSGGEFDEHSFTPDELHTRSDDMRFMFIQNAIASLIEIAKLYPEKAGYIQDEICRKLDSGFDIKIGLKDNSFIEFSMTGILRRQLENMNTIRRTCE